MRMRVCLWLAGLAIAGLADGAMAEDPAATAARQYDAVVALQNGGQYDQAADRWAKFIADHPNSRFVPQAMFHRGECLYHGGKKPESAEQFAQVLDKFPGDGVAADALYALGVSQDETGRSAEAAKSFERFLKTYPTHRLAAEATMRRAAGLAQEKNYAEAASRYASVASQWPTSKLVGAANLAGGKCYYLAGDFAAARPLLERGAAAGGASLGESAHWLIRTMLKLGKPTEAVATADRLIAQLGEGPQSAQLHMDRADALYEIPSRRGETVALYSSIASKYPMAPVAPQAMYMAALAALETGDYPTAVGQATAFLAAHPNGEWTADAMHVVAESRLQLGQAAEAEKRFDELLQKFPNHADATVWKQRRGWALYRLAESYKDPKDAEKAKAAIARLIAECPDSPIMDRARFRLGELAYAAGQFKTAAAEYQQVLDRWPKSPVAPNALFGLGWSQLGLGDSAAAEKTFDAMLVKYADHALAPRARYGRGIARQQQKNFGLALEDVQSLLATAVAPTERSDVRYVVGLCQAGLKKPADAVATFEAILKDDPTYAGADKVLYEWAWALEQQGKEKEAAGRFARLAKEHAESPLAVEAQYRVGEAAFKAGNFSKAAVAFHEAWQKAGKNALGERAAHKLGWCYFRLNDFASARQTFGYERVTWPNGPLAGDAALMEGESLLMQKKPAEAIALYEKAIAETSGEAAAKAQLQIGRIQFDRKDFAEAKKSFIKAAYGYSFPQWQAEATYEAGRCCEALGERHAALRQYADLIEKFPTSEKAAQAKARIEALRNGS